MKRWSGGLEWGLRVFPVVVPIAYGTLLAMPTTRRMALDSLKENHVVELLTFATLFAGGIIGVWCCSGGARRGRGLFAYGFAGLFSVGLLFTAMEEVAWGQHFFDFPTPPWLKAINRQHEVTLHNTPVLHNRTELLRIAFGVGGILGVWLGSRGWLRAVAPPRVLLSWFVVIAVLAGLDYMNDFVRLQREFDRIVHRLSEVVEMLIGFAGLLYVWLRFRSLRSVATR